MWELGRVMGDELSCPNNQQAMQFFDTLRSGRTRQAATGAIAGMALACVGAGCARVPVAAQRLVSKPNMVFGDSMVFNDPRRLVAQIEPGSAFSGGAQAAGCTACK